ncbi:MAG TPA: hypothetical protein VJ810_35585 [Blastocatellia bacterium]|nr:hypothetical protein [Blastocatellia bacterium]
MDKSIAVSFIDLCIVTAVGVEFKIAASLLTAKSFSEESFTSSQNSPGNDENSRDKTPSCPAFSEEPRMKICRGLFGASRITVLQSEMGAVGFAERLVKHLTDNRYDALIVVGLAGGLDPRLRVGDAVLYDLCYDARALDFKRRERAIPEEIASIAGDQRLSAYLLEALTSSGHPSARVSVQAPGMTVSRIITEAEEKLSLRINYGAAAVDMETYEVFAACARFGLPAAALRVISDEAGHNIPDFNRAYDADGRMRGWRMVTTMIARPIITFRLLLSIRRALQSLRVNLQAAMSA